MDEKRLVEELAAERQAREAAEGQVAVMMPIMRALATHVFISPIEGADGEWVTCLDCKRQTRVGELERHQPACLVGQARAALEGKTGEGGSDANDGQSTPSA